MSKYLIPLLLIASTSFAQQPVLSDLELPIGTAGDASLRGDGSDGGLYFTAAGLGLSVGGAEYMLFDGDGISLSKELTSTAGINGTTMSLNDIVTGVLNTDAIKTNAGTATLDFIDSGTAVFRNQVYAEVLSSTDMINSSSGASIAGTVVAGLFSGAGGGLTGLDAGNLTTGEVDKDRLPGTINTVDINGQLDVSTTSQQIRLFDSDGTDPNDWWQFNIVNDQLRMQFRDDSAGTFTNSLFFSADGTVNNKGTLTFDGVTTDITTGTNEDLTIDPNGSGIGIVGATWQVQDTWEHDLPYYDLLVMKSGLSGGVNTNPSSLGAMVWRKSNDHVRINVVQDSPATSNNTHMEWWVRGHSDGLLERMSLDHEGKLSIGTTNSSGKVTISDATGSGLGAAEGSRDDLVLINSGNVGMTLSTGSGGTAGIISFATLSDAIYAEFRYIHTLDQLRYYSDNLAQETFTINGGGNGEADIAQFANDGRPVRASAHADWSAMTEERHGRQVRIKDNIQLWDGTPLTDDEIIAMATAANPVPMRWNYTPEMDRRFPEDFEDVTREVPQPPIIEEATFTQDQADADPTLIYETVDEVVSTTEVIKTNRRYKLDNNLKSVPVDIPVHATRTVQRKRLKSDISFNERTGVFVKRTTTPVAPVTEIVESATAQADRHNAKIDPEHPKYSKWHYGFVVNSLADQFVTEDRKAYYPSRITAHNTVRIANTEAYYADLLTRVEALEAR